MKNYRISQEEIQEVLYDLGEIPAKLVLRSLDILRDVVSKGEIEDKKEDPKTEE
jgi:hypothetical protein